MDSFSNLISVEIDQTVQNVAKSFILDPRVQFLTMDGGEYIQNNLVEKFDLVFADTWPGKFYYLEETLSMVKPGGYYIIDDLTPIDSWPDDHKEKVNELIRKLMGHKDFHHVELNWSTGINIATRKVESE